MRAPIKECPHCGSNDEFYIKVYVTGSTNYNIKFDGSEADNSEHYDHLQHKESKFAYCKECDKRLFRILR